MYVYIITFADVTNNFDYVFWCGDLNFRLGEPRAAVLRWIEQTQVYLGFELCHAILYLRGTKISSRIQ